MDTPKKLFKVVTHNTMIETYEVEASTMAEAKSACFECWTAEDNYPNSIERIEQYLMINQSTNVNYLALNVHPYILAMNVLRLPVDYGESQRSKN